MRRLLEIITYGVSSGFGASIINFIFYWQKIITSKKIPEKARVFLIFRTLLRSDFNSQALFFPLQERLTLIAVHRKRVP